MSWHYLPRRLPEVTPPGFLRKKVLPLLPGLLKSVTATLASGISVQFAPLNAGIAAARESMRIYAKTAGSEVSEEAQRIYFDNPGLDTVTVRELTRWGRRIASAGRLYLTSRIFWGLDRDGRAAQALTLLPRTGYEALMVSGLAAGTALGFFSGGPVHHQLWWDSQSAKQSRKQPDLPAGHPKPGVRRFGPPRTLTDLAADIDDLYWADAYGQAIKVTRVGEGASRRWLVSVPGTDHFDPVSTENAADLESNIRESLNLPSAMRLGVVEAIHSAMIREGISEKDRVRERVLICGHSQGGMIAVALAAMDPNLVGFTVDAVITEGAPARRLRVRPDVTILALEHDQDVIPSLDGTPRRQKDQRVVYRRSLVRPRMGPLFYAHSSTTYTETLRRFERQEQVALWGRASEVAAKLQEYLPAEDEPWRVTHHYVWQEVLEPVRSKTWDQYVSIGGVERVGRPVDTVHFEGEITLPASEPTRPLSAIAAARAEQVRAEVRDRVHSILGEADSLPVEAASPADSGGADSPDDPSLESHSPAASPPDATLLQAPDLSKPDQEGDFDE